MKRLFTFCAALFLAANMFADVVDELSIKIGQDFVGAAHAANVMTSSIKSGFVSYDKETHILYLYGATIDVSDAETALSIKGGPDPLTIMVEGSCEIKCSAAGGNALYANIPVTLTTIGGGDITFNSVNNRGMVIARDLTVNNGLSVKVKGSSYGILGELMDSKLPKIIVDGSALTAESSGYGISSIAGVELTDSELPSNMHWNAEIGALVIDEDPYSEYTGDVEIIRASDVYYLRLTTSEFKGGKVSILKDGKQVPNPYKHNGEVVVTLKAEDTEDFSFVQYQGGVTTAEYPIEKISYWDDEYVAEYKYNLKSDKTWFAMDGFKLQVYTDKFASSEDKGALYGLSTSYFITGTCVVTSGENIGDFVFATQASSTEAGVCSRSLDKTDVTQTAAINTLVAKQTVFNPIYAIAYSPTYNTYFCAAKRVSDGKNVLLSVDKENNQLTFQKLLSMTEPVTAMAIDKAGSFYFIGEDETNAKLYRLTPVLGITLSSWENLGGMGVGSSNATKRNCMEFDPYTGELLWFQSAPYSRTIRVIQPELGLSRFIANQNINASGLFQMNEMVTITLATNDSKKGLAILAGMTTKGNYAKGTEVTMSAYPYTDCRFIRWDDGNTEATRTVIANEAKTYTAEFDWEEGIVEYPIWVSDARMRTGKLKFDKYAVSSVIKNGNISFDPETNTLTLDNLEAESNEYNTIVLGQSNETMQPLTINLVGTNKITNTFTTGAALAINNWNVTFSGSGSLTIDCTMNADAVSADGSDIDFEGANVTIQANKYGIVGTQKENVSVRGSNLKVKGGQGSILKLKDFKWEYCELTSPEGAEFNASKYQLEKDGSLVKTQVVFAALPMIRAIPVEAGTGSFTIKSGDKEFTNVGWFQENEPITITAVPAKGFEFARWTFDGAWGDETQKDQWVGKTYSTTMTAGATELKALFYYKPKSTATWYAIHDDRFISFKMSDHAAKKAVAEEPYATGYTAGDYRNGNWDYRTPDGISSIPFSGLKDGQDLSGKDKVKELLENYSKVTDMAYDIAHDIMYTVGGDFGLYRVDYKEKGLVDIGEIYDQNDYYVTAYAMAADASGALYILQKSSDGVQGKLHKVTKIDKENKRVEVKPVGTGNGSVGLEVKAINQSLAFDHQTGELFWAADDYMRVIDTKTAKSYIVGDLGMTQGAQGVVVSLHCMNKKQKPDEEAIENTYGSDDMFRNGTPAVKIIRDGVLYIIKDGKTYNAQGQLLK